MPPKCPDCQTDLEDDFGIVDCKSCGAVCSVDLDGEVQIQGEVENEVYEELVLEEPPVEESVDELEDEAAEENNAEEPEIVENAFSPMGGAAFLKGLEIFTEESSAEELEHIYYDLHVSGIESSEMRGGLIETLTDERLEITEDYLKELIDEEALFTLSQISFLRLSVIYKRLLPLGVKMSWNMSDEQGSFVQDEEPSEDKLSSTGEDELEDDLS